jgi:orotate phosphoribosyltransferase
MECQTALIDDTQGLHSADEFWSKFEQHFQIGSPWLFDCICHELSLKIVAGTNAIAGIDGSLIPIAKMVSIKTGLPLLMFQRSTDQSQLLHVSGNVGISGLNVVVMDDVYQEGLCILSAAMKLRQLGARVVQSIGLLDKNRGAPYCLFNNEVDAHALFYLNIDRKLNKKRRFERIFWTSVS